MPKRAAAPPVNGVPLDVAPAPVPLADDGPAVPAIVGSVPLEDAPPVALLREPVEKPLGEPVAVTRGTMPLEVPVALAEADAEPVPFAEADLVTEPVEEAEEAVQSKLVSHLYPCKPSCSHTNRDACANALAGALEPASRGVGVGATVLRDAASHARVLANGLHVRWVRACAGHMLDHDRLRVTSLSLAHLIAASMHAGGMAATATREATAKRARTAVDLESIVTVGLEDWSLGGYRGCCCGRGRDVGGIWVLVGKKDLE